MKRIVFILVILFFNNYSFGQARVDSLSVISLKLEIYGNTSNLGSATGFIIEKNNKYYLITNLHVVTGEDYFSHAVIDSQLRKPNVIAIWHNAQTLGSWKRVGENLYDKDNNKRWIECSSNGKLLDLIALPLDNLPIGVKFYTLNQHSFDEKMLVLPGFAVSIIGFPYGLTSDGELAIWKTGHIASDFDIETNGLPMFMIDATTRPGMSGSIVVLRMSPYLESDGTHMGIGTRFLGIYSAQSNLEELGYVIKPAALKILIDKLP